MRRVFFPDSAGAWTFFGVLCAGLILIAISDLRRAKIPNRMTVTLFGLGILVNMIRGGWVASHEIEVWQFGTSGVFVGILDGLAFSICGAVLGFALYFVMWQVGVCGGGDVKLFTAIGAWLGAYHVVMLIPLTVVTLFFWIILKIASDGVKRTMKANSLKTKKPTEGKPLPRGRVTFSMPALVAVVLLMLWVFRYDMKIDKRPEQSQPEKVDARPEYPMQT